MKTLRLIGFAIYFAFAFTGFAEAQCNGVFQPGFVCGNPTGSPALPKQATASAFTGTPAGTSGQTQYNNGGVFGAYTPSGDVTVNPATGVETIQPGVVSNSKLATGAANTMKGSLNGSATSDIALVSCSAVYQFTQWVTGTGWQCGLDAVLPSRAIAATLNLSAFSAVHTLGYTSPGDGGEATFQNITTNPVSDSFPTNFSIAGGSGYTNGSFFGVLWAFTNKNFSIGTATVSGGALTAVNNAYTPGNLCKVGDTYATGSLAGGSGASITVTACSTPLGSFSDSASNHWQIITSGVINAAQFGYKADRNTPTCTSDGCATDNFNSLQAAMWYAAYATPNAFGGNSGATGSTVVIPFGTGLACGSGNSLVQPQGVTVTGLGNQSTVVKMCDSFATGVNFWEGGDPNWHFSCFVGLLQDIQLFASRTITQTAHSSMFHSNCGQDFSGLNRVYIYAGTRRGVTYEKGYGGAGTYEIGWLFISANSADPMMVLGNTIASGLSLGTTNVHVHDLSFGGPSSAPLQSTSCVLIGAGGGGQYKIQTAHLEQCTAGVEVNIPSGTGNTDLAKIENINAGSGVSTCSGTVLIDSGNDTAGNTTVEQVPIGSCTNVITNGISGGTNVTTKVTKPVFCTATCS